MNKFKLGDLVVYEYKTVIREPLFGIVTNIDDGWYTLSCDHMKQVTKYHTNMPFWHDDLISICEYTYQMDFYDKITDRIK